MMNDNNNILTTEQLKLKYQKEGYNALTNHEKIRLLISYSEKKKNIDEVTEKIINMYGNIHTAADSDTLFLMNICGISASSAILLKLIPAINNMCTLNKYNDIKLNSSENAKKFFYALLKNSPVEKFVIITANKFFSIIDKYILSEGEIDKVDISFRKIYELAKKQNTKYIFIAHCHPNSCSIPSMNDINATIKLKDSLDFINVPLVDHIIVGCDNALSMREYSKSKIFSDIPKYSIDTTTDE